MNTPFNDLEKQYKKILIDVIHGYVPDCKILLFGSRARQTNKSGADIDLAIDAGRVLTDKEMYSIKEAIEQSDIPVFVDLVDVTNVDTDFLQNISKEWVLWKP